MTTLPETKSKKKRSPFYLEGEINLILHTRMTQSLLVGHWDSQLGLWQFALKIRDLWAAHQADDPYADWFFMKIDENIHRIHEQAHELENYYQQRLAQLRGFSIKVFENPHPLQLGLKFAIPFSYMGAALLPELDYLSRQAYTLQHMGQLLEPEKSPSKIAANIRHLFSIPMGWRKLVTRQDIKENTPAAQEAISKMGKIPSPILNKEIQFSLLLKK